MSLETFNWNDLKVFLTVARDGSLAKAADRLGVTHSTVFRRISSLEQQLSTKLFTRGRDGYQLTEIGMNVLRHAECVSDDINTLSRQLMNDASEASGTIRLSAPQNLVCNFLPRHMLAFNKAYPAIDVHILVGDYDLNRCEADIAIQITPTPNDTLIAHKLFSLKWGVFASPEYIKQFGVPTSIKDLGSHSIISGSNLIAQTAVYRWIESNIHKSRIIFHANDFISISRLVAAGLGVGVLPDDYGTPDLIRLFTFPCDSSVDVWLLIHPDLRCSYKIKALRDFLIKSLSTDPSIQSCVNAS